MGAKFATRYAHLVDWLIVFPGAIGFPEEAKTNEHPENLWQDMRARRFDLAIQMHGSGGVANNIVGRMDASSNAGSVQTGEPQRGGVFVEWPETLNEILPYTALDRFCIF